MGHYIVPENNLSPKLLDYVAQIPVQRHSDYN